MHSINAIIDIVIGANIYLTENPFERQLFNHDIGKTVN